MNTPLVSVVVPVFNDAKFLPEFLESIANQSLRDFEVIVSDDGSTDESRTIAEGFARPAPRFRLNSKPVNLGNVVLHQKRAGL